jgi:hypothetical protein
MTLIRIPRIPDVAIHIDGHTVVNTTGSSVHQGVLGNHQKCDEDANLLQVSIAIPVYAFG